MSRKKLSTWAAEQGVHYRTALSWVTAGKMPVPVERTPGGHFRVVVSESPTSQKIQRVVLYSRVSSSDQKDDLRRQSDRLRAFAAGAGYENVEVVEEIGSGLNGRRKRLMSVLADPTIRLVVVEHRDRLARFGVEYLEAALGAQERKLVVVEAGEQKLDLVQDFIDVETSMCARIYGRRAAKNRAQRALAAAGDIS
ncbi:MAG: IS607 family transposase [Acidimicrobiia bacterium]|nr:IS607 family transposase [Acidimicrobiia bacterium]